MKMLIFKPTTIISPLIETPWYLFCYRQ